jgi:hypothetical protein
MKKLVLITALMAAFACQAATWEPVSEDVDGETKMFVDVESVAPGMSTDGYALIMADFMFVDKKENTPVSYLIAPQSCILGGGTMLARAVVDGKGWQTVGKYQWSVEGGHLYDYAGMAMCLIAKEKMDAANPQKEVDKKPKAIPQGNMV